MHSDCPRGRQNKNEERRGKRAACCLCGEEWLAADHNLISQVTLKCLLACLCYVWGLILAVRGRRRHQRQSKCIRVVNTDVAGSNSTGQPNSYIKSGLFVDKRMIICTVIVQ